MSEQHPAAVPYIVHESEMARAERRNKALLLALVLVVILLFASNVIWLYEWTRYDYVSTETVTVDGSDGVASYIGNDGSIVYGENYKNPIPLTDKSGQQRHP